MKKVRGFTLIELMIAVAIVAVLAAIAIPSYGQYVLKANRSEAQSALMEISGAMERYYASKYTYVGAALGVAGTDQVSVYGSSVTPSGATLTGIKYQLSLSNLTQDGYTLTAVPVNAQTKDTCAGVATAADGTTTINGFSLSSTGQKSPAECW